MKSNTPSLTPSRGRGKKKITPPANKPSIEIRPDGAKVDAELKAARERFRKLADMALDLLTAKELGTATYTLAIHIDFGTRHQTDCRYWLYNDEADERERRQRKALFRVLKGGRQ